jgi:cell division septum initiation protein DivIVA
MSISGILSSANQHQIGATNPLQQQFQQLGQALQSGNLSSAQSDFATLQASFSQPAATTGNATSSPIKQAFNQLASDLQSGNLSAAQKDYSAVQQNFQGARGTVSRSHFNGQSHGGGASSGQNMLFQELSQLGQSPSPSTLASAQQGYTSLQQELQQIALGGAASLTSESPVSFDA